MSFDYASARKTAERLLKRFGRVVDFTQASGGYVPGTGPTPGATYQGMLATVAYSLEESAGENITFGDMRGYYFGATAPQNGDKVTLDGKEWRVANVLPLNPAGTTVYHELQLTS